MPELSNINYHNVPIFTSLILAEIRIIAFEAADKKCPEFRICSQKTGLALILEAIRYHRCLLKTVRPLLEIKKTTRNNNRILILDVLIHVHIMNDEMCRRPQWMGLWPASGMDQLVAGVRNGWAWWH